jgi:Zn-dependent protease/predicted transcriptional regulator
MPGIRAGKVLGIEIRIDHSWFIIFVLVLWTLSAGVFPATLPGLPTLAYLAMGTSATVLFFASLLAHELSHSVVARRRGVEVHEITLFLFGGMARASSEFRQPVDEFVVAGAGPLSSFIIAGLFALLSWAATATGMPAPVAAVASYLALINLVLAVFNLFPGFPLDGGRLLRAIVWHRTGDLARATRVAAAGGRVFSMLLMALGVLNLLTGNIVGGAWLLLIGWFIRTAADTSERQVRMGDRLESVRAQDIMTPHPRTVSPDLSVTSFVTDHVLGGRFQSYPVVADGNVLGLITLERVRAVPRAEWELRTVGDVMVPLDTGITVEPEEPVRVAFDRLGASSVRRVLVTHDGQLLGIISLSDVAHWLERERLRAELAPAPAQPA